MTRRVILVGNPNVGKSTIFNALTGLHQHTGNWAGVTVSYAVGEFSFENTRFSVVDLPGIYSFDTRSEEEDVTKQYILVGEYDVLALICDATCLERGLHLLEQTVNMLRLRYSSDGVSIAAESDSAASLETGSAFCPVHLVLCVNLCDEAANKGILLDFSVLEKELGIPVIPCCARDRSRIEQLKLVLSTLEARSLSCYPRSGEAHSQVLDFDILPAFSPKFLTAQTVSHTNRNVRKREETLDRIFTGTWTGPLCMLLLLAGVFWLTIMGANYPSALLWDLFFSLETILADLAASAGLPKWLIGAGIYGVYRVVAWIVSVMLPPMAIFFPLFTLLEDFGLLPRIAYNMDGAFHSCGACGKQCLTMAMGLGCNAAGVTGCRIIDSPRERLIAILTNSLVPCNGRFPLLITMISLGTMYVSQMLSSSAAHTAPISPISSPTNTGVIPALSQSGTLLSSAIPALALTFFILLGVAATLAASRLLSCTLLKGIPSSFTLELPPYRRPQVGKVIARSIFDRTLFVLARAVAVAAPAGLLIWVLGNVSVNLQTGVVTFSGADPTLIFEGSASHTLLAILSNILDAPGRLMGLDGVILMAFLLGFPANEIVLPILLMAYMQTGYLVEMENTGALLSLLTANGWTLRTFICMAVFSLFHWPCSTTCLTIRKETGSWKWTAAAFLLPALLGICLCIAVSIFFEVLSFSL